MSRRVINIVIKDNGKFELSPEQTATGNLLSLLVEAPKFDTSNVTNMSYMFEGCSALTTIPELDTSNVTKMLFMFAGCSALTTIPELDISNVTEMTGMFEGCSALENLNLVNWGDDDIVLSESMRLKPLLIHNIISQAVGTNPRELILEPSAYSSWESSEYYDTDMADAATKNITVLEA